MPIAAYLLVQVIALIFVWRHGFWVWQQLVTGLADVGSHDRVSIPVVSVGWAITGFLASLVAMGVLGRVFRRRQAAGGDESPLLIGSGVSADRAGRLFGRWWASRWAWMVAALVLIGLLYWLVPPLAVLLTVTIPALVLLALIAGTASQLPTGWLGMLAFLSFLTTFLVGAVETGLDQSRYGYSLMMMATTASLLIGLPLSWSAKSR